MGRTKVVFVLGTRPEAIKLAPVVLRGRGAPALECSLLCTGQHREMVDQALRMFSLTPDVDLNIMKHGQDLADLTAALMVGIDGYIKQRKPDLVVVQGDTTTAYSAAQVAFYNGIPVAHVEAVSPNLEQARSIPRRDQSSNHFKVVGYPFCAHFRGEGEPYQRRSQRGQDLCDWEYGR